MKKVIVFGGGVAGMSAAHELTKRRFDVEDCERHEKYPGGKARSVVVTFPGLHFKKPLPGEQGFRPEEIRNKIFQPFFNTKPTGQ